MGWCSTIGGRLARWREKDVCEEEGDDLVAVANNNGGRLSSCLSCCGRAVEDEGLGPRVAPPPIVDAVDAAANATESPVAVVETVTFLDDPPTCGAPPPDCCGEGDVAVSRS